jgi:Xaa-Pro aminopeptidase
MSTVRLMYAASGHDADMLYATRFYADDAFLWWEARGKRHIALSPLEIDRAKPVARAQVHPLAEFMPADVRAHSVTALIEGVAKKFRAKTLLVPEQFPAGLLEKLRARRLKVIVSEKPFFPERSRKTKDEVAALGAALRVAETGLRRGIDVLRASTANRRGFLVWKKDPLTSEGLRAEMDAAVLHAGGSPANTIVAGGEQGCDPHERGHGPLRANEAIVLDIFPRHARNYYYGDLTRTVPRCKKNLSRGSRRPDFRPSSAKAAGWGCSTAWVTGLGLICTKRRALPPESCSRG